MDQKIFYQRLKKIESELSSLSGIIFSMQLSDIGQNLEGYEELCTQAVMRAERLTCSFRNLFIKTNILPRKKCLDTAATAQGITIQSLDEKIIITLPGLIPKRKGQDYLSNFITQALSFRLEEFTKCISMERVKHCTICFSYVYDKALSSKRVRDYDNMECKAILDTINTYLLIDDTGLYCNTYHHTLFSTEDCTIITIMKKEDFGQWLSEGENM